MRWAFLFLICDDQRSSAGGAPHQNREGEGKSSMGNEEAKELICMTRGHELKWGSLVGGGCRAEGNKGEKKMGQL